MKIEKKDLPVLYYINIISNLQLQIYTLKKHIHVQCICVPINSKILPHLASCRVSNYVSGKISHF